MRATRRTDEALPACPTNTPSWYVAPPNCVWGCSRGESTQTHPQTSLGVPHTTWGCHIPNGGRAPSPVSPEGRRGLLTTPARFAGDGRGRPSSIPLFVGFHAGAGPHTSAYRFAVRSPHRSFSLWKAARAFSGSDKSAFWSSRP